MSTSSAHADRLRFRQVHLDFHTSEAIPGVGAGFEKKQWQDALQLGAVDSITVFAKCHHGWAYYPTRAGHVHPTLKGDLLGKQIEASHEIGVRAPIYFTVGWSAGDAIRHPEWAVRKPNGEISAVNVDFDAKPTDLRPGCSWINMCPSGGYLDLMLEQTREICEGYPVDGFFYDICFHLLCYCPNCKTAMQEAGIDLEDLNGVKSYQREKWKSFQKQAKAIIHGIHPDATVYYNGGAEMYLPFPHAEQTHFELEDLPTTWGGYNKFPLRAKYFANKGKEFLAMSGKFHTSWGEFGGFKAENALRYEAAAMVAFGSKCSIGDQLHPTGRMDPETYRRLGTAYRYVQEIEEYSAGSAPYSRLGFVISRSTEHDQGLARILLERQVDFMVADPDEDLGRFSTIIVPGHPCLSRGFARKIKAFIEKGGNALILGAGAMNAARSLFLLDLGAEYLGPARYENDYTVAGDALAKDLVTSPFLNYQGAMRVELSGGKALARVREPYFDRTYEHFCSHLNTPYREENAPHPAAWKHGRVVVLAHELDKLYHVHGAQVHRDLVVNALELVYKDPVLKVDAPSGARVSLLHQPQKRRYVAHLLYGPPVQRGRCEVIDDLVPLRNTRAELDVPQKVKRARLIPDNTTLRRSRKGKVVCVKVPEFSCHCAVVFEY